MSDEAVRTSGTVLDDLVYLTEDRIENKKVELRSGLVSYILGKLGVSELEPAEVRRVVLTVLANVAARARSEANSRLEGMEKDRQSTDEAFKAAAAGELLGIKYDENEFLLVRDRHCKAEGREWEALKRLPDNRGPSRVRRLRAGTWVAKSGKYASEKRRELLQSFESVITAYLTSPDASAQEEIAKLRVSAVGSSKLSTVIEIGQFDSISPHNDTPVVDHHVSAVETGVPYRHVERGSFTQKIVTYLHRHWILVTVEFVFSLTLVLSFFVPATVRQPWALVDNWLAYMQGVSSFGWILWFMPWLLGLFALAEPKVKAFRILLVLLVTASCLNVSSHFVVYYLDTADARGFQLGIRGGNSVVDEEFDGHRPCPAPIHGVQLSAPQLTDCEFRDGILYARQDNPDVPAIGMYAPSDVIVNSLASDYYMETQFQTVGTTPIGACGIAVELLSTGYYWFFHVKLQPQTDSPDRYVSEILSYAPIVGGTQVASNSTSGVSLPFVLRSSLPGWDYGTWTKLAIALHNQRAYFFVDDRPAGSVAGFLTTSQAGPGVNVISESSPARNMMASGDATCVFDYFHVQQLAGS